MGELERKIRLAEQGFWYDGEFRELNERSILLDGCLTDEDVVGRQHVYRDIREAFNGPELSMAGSEQQVTIYIAPDVYWIDDPEATDTMQKKEGYALPFGMYVTCRTLKIIGLSDDPEDVVIAGNRGQSHSCNGNYTLLHFQVEELSVSNLTLGNYCSVDLVYPLNPALNYPRRTEAITQAQLAIQQGEKLYAKNCRFVSRLNLNPICGAQRALYENCHFESTDDALNGNAVYVGCDFDFYGNRPIFQARGTGAVFIDCLFRSRIKSGVGESYQYLTKEGGPVTLINCQYESREGVKLGWTKYPGASLKCYQYQVSQNGRPVVLGGGAAAETLQLQGKKALEAYLFEKDGQRFGNVGNLLGGDDRWDPMGVLEAAEKSGKTGIPMLLEISADRERVISGESMATLTAIAYLFSHEISREKVTFSVRAGDEAFVKMTQDGEDSCIVEGCNHGSEAREVVIHACTESGLEAAAAVTVEPYLLPAPVFVKSPVIRKTEGAVTLDYELSSGDRADASEICWYRCDSLEEASEDRASSYNESVNKEPADGVSTGREGSCNESVNGESADAANAGIIDSYKEGVSRESVSGVNVGRGHTEEVSACRKDTDREGVVLCGVSKLGCPLKTYYLTAADEGKYMKAVILPRVRGSLTGEAVSVILEEPVKEGEVDRNRLFTDFVDMPEERRAEVRKGCWTLDCAKPADIEINSATFGSWFMDETCPPWRYGETGNGSVGVGLYQNTQGARLRYIPVSDHAGDMSMTVKADPAKTAGQGFGSAGQYMDFGIKFDTEKLTGYALRVIRTREASDAVAMALVEYREGRSDYLTKLQYTSCFLTDCTIKIALRGNTLTATAATSTLQPSDKAEKSYAQRAELEAEVEGNLHGGILIWHTGTTGTGGWQNTTMLHSIEVEYGD